jgi:hypothetical protein
LLEVSEVGTYEDRNAELGVRSKRVVVVLYPLLLLQGNILKIETDSK